MTGVAELGAVDLCSWTKPADVDWSALVADGVRLALVRSADGTTTDRACVKHVARARAAGLPVALWTYFRPALPAAAQAAELARASLACGAEGVPWIDVENASGFAAARFRDALRDTLWALDDLLDRPAGIYTGPNFWRSFVVGFGVGADVEQFADRALWIAHYGAEKPTIPLPWSSAAIWQFAGDVLHGRAVLDDDALLWPLADVLAGRRT